MYVVPLLTTLTKAMRETFDEDYAKDEFTAPGIGVDFPIKRENYPAIWIDFSPSAPTQIAGVDHKEDEVLNGGYIQQKTRWTFAGQVTFTVLTMSSFERYRLIDEVIRVLAFGKERDETATFRQIIEDNQYIAMNYNADQIDLSGFSATQGTPWGSSDFIYEATAAIGVQGEYMNDNATGRLAILERIDVYAYNDQEEDPKPQGQWV